MKKFQIGLTGGIGSGKSSVTSLLQNKGIVVIDADEISRQITAPGGKAIAKIKEVFGENMINKAGALDRAKMRALVFNQASAKKQLELIVHPLIQYQMQLELDQAQSEYIVFDIPLLIEGIERYKDRFNRICVIECDQETQIKRVQLRDNLNLEQILKIIKSQSSNATRLIYADDVIHNGKKISQKELENQVMQLHNTWLSCAKHFRNN